MTYWVHFNGENVGPYELPQLREMVAAGQLRAEDLAIEAGTSEWSTEGSIVNALPEPMAAVRLAPEPARIDAGPGGGWLKFAVIGGVALLVIGGGALVFMQFSGEPETENNPSANPAKPLPTQPKVSEKPKPVPPKVAAPPKPLSPAQIKAAWEKAGFTVGWMGPSKKYSQILFSGNLNDLVASKSVPAFKTRTWMSGVLESLPAPATAFGLNLIGSEITDAGLKEVAKLQKLNSLDLGSCNKITDAGLREMAQIQQLTSLYLHGTQITDAGLKEVAKFQQLTWLILYRCEQITDAGVAELKKALPKCEIDH